MLPSPALFMMTPPPPLGMHEVRAMPDVSDSLMIPRAKEGDGPRTGRKPPSNPVMPVLHFDDNYLIVHKPFDVRMDGDFIITVETLYEKILLESGRFSATSLPRKRYVQRLDYATSGVLIIPLSKKAAATASHQFQERTVSKVYLALVHGWIPKERTEISVPIASDPNGGFRMLCGTPSNPGRSANTTVIPLGHGLYKGCTVTKVRIELGSGRRHQIRLHLTSKGWPIVGDATYGDDDALMGTIADQVPRMMLHAWRLCIRVPDGHIYGRKSALQSDAAPWMKFEANDPFVDLLSNFRVLVCDNNRSPIN